ncbi:hypothetical protein [Ralstonia pseudosolanacearum]
MRDEEIADQIAIMKFWRGYMFFMYFLHYALGVTSVVLAVLVAGKPFSVSAEAALYKYLATALAGVTGIVAFINPERIGERYQSAFKVLSVEITRFRAPRYTEFIRCP